MGLIKAALGAAGGVLADQWKEFFYCEAIPADVLAVKGKKKVTGRSSNSKGDDNIITNGSVIAVADGQCMLIVEQGKVVDVCAEPGEYLDACDEFLTKADEGDPVRPSYWENILLVTGLSCLVSGAVCFWLLRSMKTVRAKDKANTYVSKGGLHLTQQLDQFSHTTVTRTKIQKESSGGSTHSESGGGGSGRSGKF